MTTSELSTIEKRILLRAPRDRVWRALTDVAEFSKWFGCETDGEFLAGARLDMAVNHKGSRIPFYVVVQDVEPERLLSWRWHPGMPDPSVDYSTEPTTLVEFRLEDAEHGTMLTVVETGFDRLSLGRRAGVFAQNEQGWEFQTKSLERYVGEPA